MKDLHAQFLVEARARMKALGWTHADLAKKLKVSRPRVSELLSDEHSPSLRAIQRVARALNCVATLKLIAKR